MAQPPPPLSRKTSAPWDRLRPVKQDPLESMGFVSKGDTRPLADVSSLLDPKAQESFYNKIVARYMQFCTRHSKDLDSAFASLSLEVNQSTLSGSAALRPVRPSVTQNPSSSAVVPPDLNALPGIRPVNVPAPSPSAELSTILLALRKLREGLLASSASAPSPVFSQRVHVFNIRTAILAFHPQGYHPSLLHLLFSLHTPVHPLPKSELVEMTTYLILDTAIRQNDLCQAYAMRYHSRVRFGFKSRMVDNILRAVVMGDWVTFWRVRQKVDGYVRAILYWHIETQRKLALKAIGRSYLACDVHYILQSTGGGELSWEDLVKIEDVGWMRDGNKVVIRKPKAKTAS
ncbi:hypothetical protein LTR99_005751 [Exophiala xenobiotica]|nr:hypothetical protein LTR96_004868 [Exophiala xenobiotica]KAK5302794.1 hypothetical protein LTR99_005751 [Exophiala xenobiotica]KAK5340488.1 hypothetical protein LTR98_003610 [Exophiala xenobiotica]KAK5430986.1 hypothetical protein LTR34_005545 [Exophiala xenobiotica]KAK5549332.1 hypothetical protein LTR23_000440 [Chaetothyriales sp. CCFEE 6169]